MQTQKEQCEVFAYFYSKCAELGVEVASKLVQFRVDSRCSWVPFGSGLAQFPVVKHEYRIDPFYKNWKFEPFALTVEIFDGAHQAGSCSSEAVKLDLDVFGMEALDNMGLFDNGIKEGVFEITGVIEIGPDEVHYTCTHKKL